MSGTWGVGSCFASVHDEGRTLWIGSVGDAPASVDAHEELLKLGAIDVEVGNEAATPSSDGFANGVLWPLFHYLVDRVNLEADDDWERFKALNSRFADAVVAQFRPGDRIWVHDYQLCLVPALLRERLPGASIGFFLHTPFPSPDIFRVLPWRDQVLSGILGADSIGFYTEAYRENFLSCAATILGLTVDAHCVTVGARNVRVDVVPLGVDVDRFEALSRERSVVDAVTRLRLSALDLKLVIGIDSLDHTHGIPRRLLAFERMLERHPTWARKLRFIQIVVPTREDLPGAEELRRTIAGLVARINGTYGTVDHAPVHFLHRSLSAHDLASLYCAADVMVVTPLRDGMSLVAKEFVASRVDDDGVLVLSEFAGAAAELVEAVLVNPYSIGEVADALFLALTMFPERRAARMRALRRHVRESDLHKWTSTLLDGLGHAPTEAAVRYDAPRTIASTVASASHLCLLLDYDGTLVGLERTPELAVPDRPLCALLERLAAHPRVDVHIVSGRPRGVLDQWFQGMRVGLHAEHGFWWRLPDAEWEGLPLETASWKPFVRPILDALAARVIGSFVEEKEASLAWHYRTADAESLRNELRAVKHLLEQATHGHPIEILDGAKVLELRARGVHKGLAVARILAAAPPRARLVALGDDTTDEDMFAALVPQGFTIRVGDGRSQARFRVRGPSDVRALLSDFAGHMERRSTFCTPSVRRAFH